MSVPEEHVSPSVVNAALEAVTRLDEQLISKGESPTSHQLIAQGAKWRPEPPGDECFDHGGTIATRGWGDCDDWAPLHAATLRTSGQDPGAKAIVVPSGPTTYHAIVQRSDGALEDPSIAAGMRPIRTGRVGGIDGESIEILACDPHDPNRVYQGSLLPTQSPMSLHCGPNFAVRGAGSGIWEARCDVPMHGVPMASVRSGGRSGVAAPYALSVQAYAPHPGMAVQHAVVGALDLANATGVADASDYYKMTALHGLMCGVDPRAVHADLCGALCACGCPPEQASQLATQHVVGAWRMAGRFVKRHRRHRRHVHGMAQAPAAAAWRA
jgi:hypothetical protein